MSDKITWHKDDIAEFDGDRPITVDDLLQQLAEANTKLMMFDAENKDTLEKLAEANKALDLMIADYYKHYVPSAAIPTIEKAAIEKAAEACFQNGVFDIVARNRLIQHAATLTLDNKDNDDDEKPSKVIVLRDEQGSEVLDID